MYASMREFTVVEVGSAYEFPATLTLLAYELERTLTASVRLLAYADLRWRMTFIGRRPGNPDYSSATWTLLAYEL
jgi:hypothetical protein